MFDEIWTASNFSKEVFQPLDKRVSIIPLLGNFYSGNRIIEIPFIKNIIFDGSKVKKFLFMFDYLSSPYRKNIFQLIDIFKEISKSGRNFKLILKIKNAPAAFINKIKSLSDGLPIFILEMELIPAELKYLYNNVDYYVSLHSSEGYGLTVLESIYYNVTPITTAYGGVLDFCDDKNSILVGYDMVNVPKEATPYSEGQWARPRQEEAITKICSLIDDPIIRKPSREIFKQINDEVLSKKVLELLKEIIF